MITKPWMRKYTEEQVATLMKATEHYKSPHGKVLWKKLYKSEPSLARLTSKRNLQNIYNREMRKQRAGFERHYTPAQATNGEPQPSAPAARYPKFCPECGEPLIPITAARSLPTRLTRKAS